MLLETRNKCGGVEWVLDQHKCCRERAKFEFLVTQKKNLKKGKRRGRQPGGSVGLIFFVYFYFYFFKFIYLFIYFHFVVSLYFYFFVLFLVLLGCLICLFFIFSF